MSVRSKTSAQAFLASYKRLLKQWTMASIGIRPGDSYATLQKLKSGLPTLASIKATYPEFAYSVDILENALTRHGSTEESRSLRPDGVTN